MVINNWGEIPDWELLLIVILAIIVLSIIKIIEGGKNDK
jgi:hypothetical protein